MSTIDYAPFDGDGRVKSYPPAVRFLEAGRPTAVRNSVARNLIESFERQGASYHSAQLSTLWVLITWCQHHKHTFQVWRYTQGDLSSYAIYLGSAPDEVKILPGSGMVLSSLPKPQTGQLDLAVRWSSGNSSITATITQDQYQRILAITQEKP